MGGKSFRGTSFGQIIKHEVLGTGLTIVLTWPRARVARVVTRGALCPPRVQSLAPGTEGALARGQEAEPRTRGAVEAPGPGAGGAGGVTGTTLIGGGVRPGPGGAGEAAARGRGQVGEAVTGEAVPGPGA